MRRAILLAPLAATVLLVAGCGSSSFEDRTAKVSTGGRTTEFRLDSCGLDGRTLFLVGRSPGGATLQAVVDVRADGTTGVRALTGVSVFDGPESFDAFGARAWKRRKQTGTPPGRIDSARLKGARIQVQGQAQPVDPDTEEPSGGSLRAFALDARCDDQDGS